MTELDRAAVAAVDRSGQIDHVLALSEHLRDALWRVESAALQAMDSPGGLVVAGMGGSGIGGALAAAALGDRASRAISLARSYQLPSWAAPDATVLCCSYSGDTEETLACYEAAGVVGARRVVVTTGGRLAEAARTDGVPVIPLPAGLQPRASVGYVTVAALEVAALCGVGPNLRSEIDVAASHAEEYAAAWGPDAGPDVLPKALARGLRDTIPVIAGAGLTASVAYRWKTQLNENAKIPAFSHELPELDHNEIVGWEGATAHGRFSAVFLDDEIDLHPRLRSRIPLTRELVQEAAAATFVVPTLGENRTDRVLSLVLLGDLVSLYLAVLRAVDPEPVAIIERLKAELARS